MNLKHICIAGLALALSSVTAVAQDASARTVQYHSQDIVPIHAKLKYTTLETHRKSAREYRSVLSPELLSKSAAKEKETQ